MVSRNAAKLNLLIDSIFSPFWIPQPWMSSHFSSEQEIPTTMVRTRDQNVSERLVRHVHLASPKEKRPRSRPRTRWRYYTSDLAWSHLVVEPVELLQIAENREVFLVLLEVLPMRPSAEQKRVRKWMNEAGNSCKFRSGRAGVSNLRPTGHIWLTVSFQMTCVIIFAKSKNPTTSV